MVVLVVVLLLVVVAVLENNCKLQNSGCYLLSSAIISWNLIIKLK